MRISLPCGAEASVSESVSPETIAALDEMMVAVCKYYVEKMAKEVLQQIGCGSAGQKADHETQR